VKSELIVSFRRAGLDRLMIKIKAARRKLTNSKPRLFTEDTRSSQDSSPKGYNAITSRLTRIRNPQSLLFLEYQGVFHQIAAANLVSWPSPIRYYPAGHVRRSG